MNADAFWSIIESTKSEDHSDRQPKLVEYLSELPRKEIEEFEQELRRRIMEANDYGVLAAAKIIDGFVSDDSFLYFRCWLIGKGREIFYKTLEAPDSLADYVSTDETAEFEELLYVSSEAAETKGDPEDFEDPRHIALDAGLHYDDGELSGTDWTEDELPERYPNLWRKFNL